MRTSFTFPIFRSHFYFVNRLPRFKQHRIFYLFFIFHHFVDSFSKKDDFFQLSVEYAFITGKRPPTCISHMFRLNQPLTPFVDRNLLFFFQYYNRSSSQKCSVVCVVDKFHLKTDYHRHTSAIISIYLSNFCLIVSQICLFPAFLNAWTTTAILLGIVDKSAIHTIIPIIPFESDMYSYTLKFCRTLCSSFFHFHAFGHAGQHDHFDWSSSDCVMQIVQSTVQQNIFKVSLNQI